MTKTIGERVLTLPNFLMAGKNRRDDISYGAHADMKYDIFPAKKANAPIIMFWHGGGWKTGNKEMYRFMGHALQRLKFQVVVVGYPLYPDQNFPGFIADAHKAIDQVRREYPERKVFLMGHSAGGHTALIAAMTAKRPVDGVISVSAPITISKKYWSDIFGTSFEKNLEKPQTYINKSPGSTKYLLIHGALDITVAVRDSLLLNKCLLSGNRDSTTLIMKLADHMTILPLLAFGPAFRTRRRIKTFVES